MDIDQKDIEQYLSEVKDAVEKNDYRLARNARRQDNICFWIMLLMKRKLRKSY